LIEIEKHYRLALPLPNPDVHEVIGEQINLVPSKVFFGINLVREKMRLPKLEYPKRKLAVTPEQLMAIETLYEPYLPLPPLGIHKIISKQLRMDEWRVHVAIGLIRKNRNLARWNEDRDDLPAEMREAQQRAREEKEAQEKEAKKAQAEKEKAGPTQAEAVKAESAGDQPEATSEEATAATTETAVKKQRAKKAVATPSAEPGNDEEAPSEEDAEAVVVVKPKAKVARVAKEK